ncbi:MAG: T9SS type A sorting domain-containing protein [Bacteroidota bacterium]
MFKSTFVKSLYFLLILVMPYGIYAQVQFGIRVQEDTKTYEVVMRSSTTWAFPYNLTSTAQVTLKVPHSDVVGQSFTVDNLTTKVGGASWVVNGRLNNHQDAAGYDIISIGLNSLGVPLPFTNGMDTVVFSFVNNGACLGTVSIIDNTDAIVASDKHNLSLANQINTFGSLNADAFTGSFVAGPNNCTDFLPVELLDFSAQGEGNKVRLDWTTAYELNNDYFTVERSTNGLSFQVIEKVEGAGTSQGLNQYFAYDNKPLSGKTYYRLKQTDFDGTFAYSEVIELNFDAQQLALNLQAFPNPIASATPLHLTIDAPQAAMMMLEIVDQKGRKKHHRPLYLNAGSNQIELGEINWAAGIYFLRIFDESVSQSQKIIVH